MESSAALAQVLGGCSPSELHAYGLSEAVGRLNNDSSSDSDLEAVLGDSNLQPPSSRLPASADWQLTRAETEHALSLATMRHEYELSNHRHAARRAQQELRQELRRQRKAMAALVLERDELHAQLVAVQSEASNQSRALEASVQRHATVVERLAAVERSGAQHQRQLAATRAQAEAQREGFEAAAAMQRERLTEETARAEAAGRVSEQLRAQVDALKVERLDLLRWQEDAREKLSTGAERLASTASEKEVIAERLAGALREVERLDASARAAADVASARAVEVQQLSAALAAAREQRNQASRDADRCRSQLEDAHEEAARVEERTIEVQSRSGDAERRLQAALDARGQAEAALEQATVQRRWEREARQRRMLRLLLRAARSLRALGFWRWRAATASLGMREAWEAEVVARRLACDREVEVRRSAARLELNAPSQVEVAATE